MSDSAFAPSEKHLEDWIVDNYPSAFPHGGHIVGRQLATPAGRIDILSFGTHFVDVIELKRGPIDGAALFQVLRYMRVLTSVCYTAHVRGRYKCDPDIVRGILIGHSVNDAVHAAADQARVGILLYEFHEPSYDFRPTTFNDPRICITSIIDDPLTKSLEKAFCGSIGQMYAKWDAASNNNQEVQG